MKAAAAVENLRKLADLLEKHGDAEIWMASAVVWVSEKKSFLALAKDLPRPYAKKFEEGPYADLELQHGKLDETGTLTLKIPRSQVCKLVTPAKPAVYDCPSIFSPEEEAELAESAEAHQ